MEELKLGQEVTGEVIGVSKFGYCFLRLDDNGEVGVRNDLFIHRSEFEEGFGHIELGAKVVCLIGRDEIQKERIKGVNAQIIKQER